MRLIQEDFDREHDAKNPDKAQHYCQFCGGWAAHATPDHSGDRNDPARGKDNYS
jgi:hypothetical protein